MTITSQLNPVSCSPAVTMVEPDRYKLSSITNRQGLIDLFLSKGLIHPNLTITAKTALRSPLEGKLTKEQTDRIKNYFIEPKDIDFIDGSTESFAFGPVLHALLIHLRIAHVKIEIVGSAWRSILGRDFFVNHFKEFGIELNKLEPALVEEINAMFDKEPKDLDVRINLPEGYDKQKRKDLIEKIKEFLKKYFKKEPCYTLDENIDNTTYNNHYVAIGIGKKNGFSFESLFLERKMGLHHLYDATAFSFECRPDLFYNKIEFPQNVSWSTDKTPLIQCFIDFVTGHAINRSIDKVVPKTYVRLLNEMCFKNLLTSHECEKALYTKAMLSVEPKPQMFARWVSNATKGSRVKCAQLLSMLINSISKFSKEPFEILPMSDAEVKELIKLCLNDPFLEAIFAYSRTKTTALKETIILSLFDSIKHAQDTKTVKSWQALVEMFLPELSSRINLLISNKEKEKNLVGILLKDTEWFDQAWKFYFHFKPSIELSKFFETAYKINPAQTRKIILENKFGHEEELTQLLFEIDKDLFIKEETSASLFIKRHVLSYSELSQPQKLALLSKFKETIQFFVILRLLGSITELEGIKSKFILSFDKVHQELKELPKLYAETLQSLLSLSHLLNIQEFKYFFKYTPHIKRELLLNLPQQFREDNFFVTHVEEHLQTLSVFSQDDIDLIKIYELSLNCLEIRLKLATSANIHLKKQAVTLFQKIYCRFFKNHELLIQEQRILFSFIQLFIDCSETPLSFVKDQEELYGWIPKTSSLSLSEPIPHFANKLAQSFMGSLQHSKNLEVHKPLLNTFYHESLSQDLKVSMLELLLPLTNEQEFCSLYQDACEYQVNGLIERLIKTPLMANASTKILDYFIHATPEKRLTGLKLVKNCSALKKHFDSLFSSLFSDKKLDNFLKEKAFLPHYYYFFQNKPEQALSPLYFEAFYINAAGQKEFLKLTKQYYAKFLQDVAASDAVDTTSTDVKQKLISKATSMINFFIQSYRLHQTYLPGEGEKYGLKAIMLMLDFNQFFYNVYKEFTIDFVSKIKLTKKAFIQKSLNRISNNNELVETWFFELVWKNINWGDCRPERGSHLDMVYSVALKYLEKNNYYPHTLCHVNDVGDLPFENYFFGILYRSINSKSKNIEPKTFQYTQVEISEIGSYLIKAKTGNSQKTTATLDLSLVNNVKTDQQVYVNHIEFFLNKIADILISAKGKYRDFHYSLIDLFFYNYFIHIPYSLTYLNARKDLFEKFLTLPMPNEKMYQHHCFHIKKTTNMFLQLSTYDLHNSNAKTQKAHAEQLAFHIAYSFSGEMGNCFVSIPNFLKLDLLGKQFHAIANHAEECLKTNDEIGFVYKLHILANLLKLFKSHLFNQNQAKLRAEALVKLEHLTQTHIKIIIKYDFNIRGTVTQLLIDRELIEAKGLVEAVVLNASDLKKLC